MYWFLYNVFVLLSIVKWHMIKDMKKEKILFNVFNECELTVVQTSYITSDSSSSCHII